MTTWRMSAQRSPLCQRTLRVSRAQWPAPNGWLMASTKCPPVDAQWMIYSEVCVLYRTAALFSALNSSKTVWPATRKPAPTVSKSSKLWYRRHILCQRTRYRTFFDIRTCWYWALNFRYQYLFDIGLYQYRSLLPDIEWQNTLYRSQISTRYQFSFDIITYRYRTF